MNTPTVINPLAFLGFKKEAKDSIKRNVTIDKDEIGSLIKKVSNFFEVDIEDLKGVVRKRELVEVRQIIMYVLINHSKLTLKRIGMLFNRDHSTVLYSRNTVDDMLTSDKKFRFRFQSCCETIFEHDPLSRNKFLDIIKQAKTNSLR